MPTIKYAEFVGVCRGKLVGEGTDFEGHLRDNSIGAERALAKLNKWRDEAPRTILSMNVSIETSAEPPIFFVRVLYEE